jgi:hypothetical protein
MRLMAVTVVAFAATGCASLFGSFDVAPNGLAGSDDRLRRMLSTQQAPAAFDRVQKNAPDDEMLHALYHGALAYHAGNYAESARALDIAAHIADERMTLSLSRAALSVVTSDLALQYTPGRTERLMIPYYAALARMQMGDREGAAVEARRLSMLLQRYDDERAAIDPVLRASLRYLAGAVFAWSGEYGDADVAFRNAVAIDASLPAYAAARGKGTVLVVLEQGFIAHRVEQGINVMLLPEEVNAIAHGGADDKALASAFVAGRIIDVASRGPYARNYGSGTLHVPAPDRELLPASLQRLGVRCVANATTATTTASSTTTTTTTTTTSSAAGTVVTITTDTVPPATATGVTPVVGINPTGGGTPRSERETRRQQCAEGEREVEDLPYLLRIAWPAYRTDYRPEPARLLVGADAIAFGRTADLSAGVVADFEKERAALLVRTIARSTAKLALTKGAERRLEEKNEVAGRIVGLLGNVGTALLERADTRSWHLLPSGMSVLRVELAAGEHELAVDVGGRRIVVGPVTVGDGSLHILPARAW